MFKEYFCGAILVSSALFACDVSAQPEMPRGDAKANSMEKQRSNPVGGRPKSKSEIASQKTAKYKAEKAAIDKKLAENRNKVRQETRAQLKQKK